ncbi:metallophosphoesterase [Bdellovibrio sp. 22V]|uniref:metallophosphoesterase family protein n=1 Tax=Bdellovibrio sp. 22V TaxID=3044166 RepID=UPI0025435378|nr:metallophosphoesterase [Bdellovibrio sp. 22V]WII73187.1 metallophosphoesterase [Bdellovibrio sp. 22V]
MKQLLMALTVGLALGCAPLKNSPFSEETQSSVTNRNQHQLVALNEKISLQAREDKIVFGAVADTHQNYSALEDWVKVTNTTSLDFAVHLGDFTNQGLNFEYDAYLNLISPLKVPLVTVIGNHDTVAKGKLLYQRLFGPYNFHFDLKGYRFIVFNNNRLDFINEGVDWNWLALEVRSSSLPIVLFMHVDPDNFEYFRPQDRDLFWDIVRDANVRLIMNGHKHIYQTEFKEGVLRHQVERLQNGAWSRITLTDDMVKVEKCLQKECRYETQQDYPPAITM